jgi:hypothetical protein
MLAGGCMLTAAALALGSAQASSAAALRAPARHHAGAAALSAGWHSFNPGLPDLSPFSIYAPTVSSAWGAGETASGASAYLHFNGSSWKSMSGPNIGPIGYIGGTSASDLWAISANKTAHFNGSSWTTYALEMPAGQQGLGPSDIAGDQIYVASATDVYAEVDTEDSTGSGGFLQILEHFDGTSWSIIATPDISVDGFVTEVTGSGPDDVYAVTPTAVDHFNGTAWSTEALPGTPDPIDLTVTGPGTAMVLGYNESGGGYGAKLSDGKWSKVSLPSGLGPLTEAPDLSSAGEVWANMQTTSSGSDGPITLWEYSGGTWKQITPDKVTADMFGIVDGGGLWATPEAVAPASDLYVS